MLLLHSVTYRSCRNYFLFSTWLSLLFYLLTELLFEKGSFLLKQLRILRMSNLECLWRLP